MPRTRYIACRPSTSSRIATRSRVCIPSARARTLLRNLLLRFAVSRRRCVGYARVRVYTCRMHVCVRAFLRSLACSLVVRSFVHPSDGDVRANLDVARRFCFIRESSSSFVRTRALPSSRSCRRSVRRILFSLSLSLCFERKKKTEGERGQLERALRAARLISLSPPPARPPPPPHPRRPECASTHPTRTHLGRVRTPLCAYRAGLQRNAKESLTSTHP